MTTAVPEEQSQLDKLKGFTEAVIPSFSGDMVQDIAEKAVKGMELSDEILQPDTIELLRTLPEVSKNLQRLLLEIKRLEESGVLSSLLDLVQLVSSAKNALTGEMIIDLSEKAVAGVELADSIIQKDTIDLLTQALTAFEQAKTVRKDSKPTSKMQLLRQMNQQDTLEGLSFMLTFLQKFSIQMNQSLEKEL